MPAPSSFEADLRALREARNLSLADIQDQTRIPLDVLRRFEEGDLVGDPTYNEVYLKAFLQSYAKAIGQSPSEVKAAYDEQKAGRYAGSLHPDFDPASAPAPPEPTETPKPVETVDDPKAPARPASSDAAPAVEALSRTPDPTARPTSSEPPKTLAQARVNRPSVPTARRSFDKNWGPILGLFGVLVVGLALAFYFLVFAGDDDPANDAPDTIAVGEGPEVAVDSAGVGTAASTGPRFQRPIALTATATGGTMSPLRVYEDGEYREYWVEVDDSVTLEADSALVIEGVGAEDGTFENAVLQLQGQRFRPTPGAVLTISPATGQALLDSLASAPAAPAVGE